MHIGVCYANTKLCCLLRLGSQTTRLHLVVSNLEETDERATVSGLSASLATRQR